MTVNALPWPRPGLDARTVPPCISTMRCTKGRPSPSPPLARSSVRGACAKSSKTWGRNSGLMPLPVSRTMMRASPSEDSIVTPTCPPGSVYLTAFVNRFSTTCVSRTESPTTSARFSDTDKVTSCLLAPMNPLAVSTAARTTSTRSTRSLASEIFPDMTRAMSRIWSSRVPMRSVCRTSISRTCSARARSSGCMPRSSTPCVSAASGLRSS